MDINTSGTNAVIIDAEIPSKKKRLAALIHGYGTKDFNAAVELHKKEPWYKDVVQIVNPITGETVKGPKYDTTMLEPTEGADVSRFLSPGIKQQPPIEDTQSEPRDRVQENKHMKKQNFQALIKECISEVKTESNPKAALKESLRRMVKSVLSEISSGTKPEADKEDKEIVSKGYAKDGHERIDKTNVKLQKELETLVHGINADWEVYWDDHMELNVDAKNLLRVRITPKYENNYDIDAMVKLVDRIRVISVTWEQVKAFVKANFSDLKDETHVDVAREKSLGNQKEKKENDGKDAGPRHDITNLKKVGDTKKDNKDYNQKQVEKDEDQPDQPMADSSKSKALNKNIEKTQHVKPPKVKSDEGSNKLKTDLPATKKFRARK